jgi:hypothetical protein
MPKEKEGKCGNFKNLNKVYTLLFQVMIVLLLFLYAKQLF